MRGTEPSVRGPEIPGPSGDWLSVPAIDFDGDGMADALWYNPTTRRMAVWRMHGTVPFVVGPEIPGPSGGGWRASLARDFDGDGLADVLWYDAGADRTAVWLMRGTAVRARGPELPAPSGGFYLAAANDMNGDLMADDVLVQPQDRARDDLADARIAHSGAGPRNPGAAHGRLGREQRHGLQRRRDVRPDLAGRGPPADGRLADARRHPLRAGARDPRAGRRRSRRRRVTSPRPSTSSHVARGVDVIWAGARRASKNFDEAFVDSTMPAGAGRRLACCRRVTPSDTAPPTRSPTATSCGELDWRI